MKKKNLKKLKKKKRKKKKKQKKKRAVMEVRNVDRTLICMARVLTTKATYVSVVHYYYLYII